MPIARANAVERFFSGKTVLPALSPDGHTIALLDDDRQLMLANTHAPQQRRYNQALLGQPTSLFWIDRSRLLVETRDGTEQRLYLLETIKPAQQQLISWSTERGLGLRVLSAQPSRNRLLIAFDREQPYVPHVYSLTFDGQLTLLHSNSGDVARWIPDGSGQIRLAQAWRVENEEPVYELRYLSRRSGNWRSIVSHPLTVSETRPLGFAGDGSVVLSRDNQLLLWSPRTGMQRRVLENTNLINPTALHWGSNGLAMVTMNGILPEALVIDERWQQRFRQLDSITPGLRQQLLGRAGDFSLWLASGDTEPGIVLLHNAETGSVDLVDRLLPALDRASLAPTLPFSSQTPDGVPLQGYLTQPLGSRSKPAPIVVLIHGGPWARDSWGFDAEVQFLASLGFAVLQVNFRGSRGVTHELMLAGFRQFGRRMQDDLNWAVDFVAERFDVDDARVCLMGASYGGYAALTGVLRDADRYQCAVAFAPVTDLADQLSALMRMGNRRGYSEWRYMIGDPIELTDLSPLASAAKLNRPALIGHGQQDQTVPIRHSDRFVRAAPPPLVRLVRLADAGHTLPSSAQQRDWYRRVREFLNGQLKP